MMVIRQKYIVMLAERNGEQVWLAYDNLGRIGNATYAQAYRYDTWAEAADALRRLRFTGAKWPGAKIMGTTVHVEPDSYESAEPRV